MVIREEIKLGASLLDEHYGPGWEEKIDLNILELANCSRCVLGQIFKGYLDGVIYLMKRFMCHGEPIFLDGSKYGFVAKAGKDWYGLKNEWVEEISLRLEDKKELRELCSKVELEDGAEYVTEPVTR